MKTREARELGKMGCGGTKEGSAGTPRLHDTFQDIDMPGKLPRLVLEGWARVLGTPLSNPYKRSRPPPAVLNRGKSLFTSDTKSVSLNKDTAQCAEMRTDLNQQLDAASDDSPDVRRGGSRPVPPDLAGATYSADPVSPLAPRVLLEESDDEERISGGCVKQERLQKERQAGEEAAKFAAAQSKEAEEELAQQSAAITHQKLQADAILAKYG